MQFRVGAASFQLALASVLSAAPLVSALWPLPRNLDEGTTALRLSPNLDIEVSSGIASPPQDLYDAITRTRTHLLTDNLGRLVVGRGASDVSSFETAAYLSTVTLSLESGADVLSITAEAQKPLEQRDEAYTLTVPSNGSAALITANSTLGLLRGLTTFEQLWYEYDGTIYAVNTPLSIQDSPAYVCARSSSGAHKSLTPRCHSHTVASCWTLHATSTTIFYTHCMKFLTWAVEIASRSPTYCVLWIQ